MKDRYWLGFPAVVFVFVVVTVGIDEVVVVVSDLFVAVAGVLAVAVVAIVLFVVDAVVAVIAVVVVVVVVVVVAGVHR